MKELVVYLTSSYPDVAFTKDLIARVADAGADRIEIGVPFSDPVADGKVIQEVNMRSLAAGFKVADIYEISATTSHLAQLYWMGYANTFYRKGFAHMAAGAEKAGVKGFIIPDLPYEEALPYQALFEEHRIDNIAFVAPTDSRERIAQVATNAKGFVYMVAYAGITGAGRREELHEIIAGVRDVTRTPLFLGFGVDETNAREKAQDVDGVIVGSAIVKHLLDDSLTIAQKMDKIVASVARIKDAINS